MFFNLGVLEGMQYAAKVAKFTEDWHIQGKQGKPAQTHLLLCQIKHYSTGTVAIPSGITENFVLPSPVIVTPVSQITEEIIYQQVPLPKITISFLLSGKGLQTAMKTGNKSED